MRRLAIGTASLALVALLVFVAAASVRTSGVRAAGTGPTVAGTALVDLDHNLPFSQNKQNEPAITRDPLTGVLIAGANDEISQPLCTGTTVPLASPCPFLPG